MGIKFSPNTMTKKGGFKTPNFSVKSSKSIATKGKVVKNTNKDSGHRRTSTTN